MLNKFTAAIGVTPTKTKKAKPKSKKKVGVPPPSMKIIVNIFYEPVDALKKKLEDSKDVYFPIHGGCSRPDVFISNWTAKHVQRDDVGDNISMHNHMLNEMTAIYWAWKHYDDLRDPEYIGFNHYRRFFRIEDLEDRDDYDIICAERIREPVSIYKAYEVYHVKQHMDIMLNIVKGMKCPFEGDIENTFKGIYMYPCNMFVMRKELFFEYCEEMFRILFELEKYIDLRHLDKYQQRAICFLGERITSAWISWKMNQGFKVKQVPIEFHESFKDNKLNERGTY